VSEILPCVEIEPPGGPSGTVLWLHGLGADGHDFEPIVPLLIARGAEVNPPPPDLTRLRFVFPHAPERPVTINGGMVMRAWYDVRALGAAAGAEDRGEDVRRSAALIEALLAREEERGVPSSRIVLAGFSQGGAMALHVGVRHRQTLRGIMVLSGYEVLSETRDAEAVPANRLTPLLACHGTADPLVDIRRARSAYDAHAASGRPAEWHEFPIGHEVSAEEIAVIRRWLGERFG